MNMSFMEATEWGPVVNMNEVTAELGEFRFVSSSGPVREALWVLSCRLEVCRSI